MSNEMNLPDLGLEEGDEFEAFGLRWTVTQIMTKATDYPVRAETEAGQEGAFTCDGRDRTWHRTPSITRVMKKTNKEAKKKILRRALIYHATTARYLETDEYHESEKALEKQWGRTGFVRWLPGAIDEDGNPVEDGK